MADEKKSSDKEREEVENAIVEILGGIELPPGAKIVAGKPTKINDKETDET